MAGALTITGFGPDHGGAFVASYGPRLTCLQPTAGPAPRRGSAQQRLGVEDLGHLALQARLDLVPLPAAECLGRGSRVKRVEPDRWLTRYGDCS